MKIRISKRLEGIIARTAFDTTRTGVTRSLKDFLMLEMLRDEESLACQLLTARLKEWELHQVRLRIEHDILSVTGAEHHSPEHFFRKFIDTLHTRADASASCLTTAHALQDIAADRTTVTAHVLELYGITAERLADDVRRLPDESAPGEFRLLQPDPDERNAAEHTREPDPSSLLEKFGVELTRLARDGKIDPVVGREEEIERVVQILSRRKKNNPVLIGEAGVGKSAIVEGLALRIVAGEVPHTLAGKRLYALDISSLVAGTKFRGEFEERMQQLLDELRRSKQTLLFIDEVHTIVGAGSTQGSLDTANILKPALARGELQIIGATTFDEYRTDIESDAALERRFQRVTVEPTTPEQTLRILHNVAPVYEAHHHVRYTEEALQACVELTGRYITDRHFPDKAIDALDEVGARVHLQAAREPEPLRRIEAELAAVRREHRHVIEQFACEKAASTRRQELTLRAQLGERRAAWRRTLEQRPAEVTARHVREVITAMTGIPAERVSGDERLRLQQLGAYLSERVIGQEEAVERIARTIRRSRSGLKEEGRPMGVFLFVGPTGVGKTLLAKEVSKWLFDERRGLIRIDMSEYGEKHNVARLIGSPPGYVGYGEGGQLTEAVRRQPHAVVLFDEIEKAHPDLFNTMLQLFDEGFLTDGSGRRVDFRNTIVIMTSNVGSREAARKSVQVGYATGSKEADEALAPQSEYRRALEQCFAPEFLNRVDDIVIFRSLEPKDVERIVERELHGLRERARKLGYRMRITDGARQRLAAMGYERRYGARALRRTLLDHVEEPLSALIIDGKLREGDTVVVESDRSHGIRLRVA